MERSVELLSRLTTRLDFKTRFTLEEIFPDSWMFPDSSVFECSDSLAFTLKGFSDS